MTGQKKAQQIQNNCVDTNNNCIPCNQATLKANAGCEACTPLTVECATIDEAVCTPVLSEQIFDCICIEKERNSYLEDVKFIIDTDHHHINHADPICIQNIGITYDFIGLEDDWENRKVIIDGNEYRLTPQSTFCCKEHHHWGADPMTQDAVAAPEDNDSVAPQGGSVVSGAPGGGSGSGHSECSGYGKTALFNELEGPVTLNRCCCLTPTPTASRARIIEKNRKFKVCGLKLIVSGIIGSTPFTATSTIEHHKNPLSLTHDLNFDDLTFVGRICLPLKAPKVVIHEEFNSCLQIEAVTPTGGVFPFGPGRSAFNAAVELSFKVNKTIYATVRQKLAVFTTPAVLCRNGNVLSSCASICPDDEQ